MGGIAGYGDPETTDESPERVTLLQRATTGYLHGALNPGDREWTTVLAGLHEAAGALGEVESK